MDGHLNALVYVLASGATGAGKGGGAFGQGGHGQVLLPRPSFGQFFLVKRCVEGLKTSQSPPWCCLDGRRGDERPTDEAGQSHRRLLSSEWNQLVEVPRYLLWSA